MTGILNLLTLWPVVLVLIFTQQETLHWQCIPWSQLTSAAVMSLAANMLANLSILVTYEQFITLGLIAAVPVSAVCDIIQYESQFSEMKLAGIIFIVFGFLLVLTPSNINISLMVPLR